MQKQIYIFKKHSNFNKIQGGLLVTMVNKHPIAKACTGLLAGFLLFNNQSNAQEPITNNYKLDTEIRERVELKLDKENPVNKFDIYRSFENRLNRKLESRFSVNAQLSDYMNNFNTKTDIQQIYADRVVGAFESSLEDVGREFGEHLFGTIGRTLFTPKDERSINVPFYTEQQGVAGEYFGKIPHRWRASFDPFDGDLSINYNPGSETLVNLNFGANGASIRLRKELFNNINLVTGVEYGGLRLNLDNPQIDWDQNMNIFLGVSKEIRKKNEYGIESITQSFQAGINAQNPSDSLSPSRMFFSVTYNRKF